VALRLRPAPEQKRYEGWFFHDFAEGAAALRELIQLNAAPDVARLSDEEETRVTLALAGQEGAKALAGRTYLRARGYSGGCLAIFGWEGTADDVARRRERSTALARAAGGLRLGQSVGRAWAHSRFETPYLRDDMLARGLMVETLETATTWSNLHTLHRMVGEALRESLSARGTPPIVYCHVSHLYETGASLYFTFIARQEEGAEIEQWRAAKQAACDAIVANGGTLTHHHAVGVDHAPWLAAEDGETGVAILRAVKAQLDPNAIMNPGKLLA
jgi:alkyldihydroxyacetonephosphate synthase